MNISRFPAVVLFVMLSASGALAAGAPSDSRRTASAVAQGDGDPMKRVDDKLELAEQKNALKLDAIRESITLTKEAVSNSQKIVDWWIAFLSIFVAIVGLAIPYLAVRSVKRDYEKEVRKASEAAAVAAASLEEIKSLLSQAKDDSGSIRRNRELLENAMKEGSNAHPSPEEGQAIEQTLQNPNAPAVDTLRALALKSENEEKWLSAATIWKSLAELDKQNHFYEIRYATCMARAAEIADIPKRAAMLKQALSSVEKILQSDPKNDAALLVAANICFSLSEVETEEEAQLALAERALGMYEQAAAVAPASPYIHYNWAAALRRTALIRPGSEMELLRRAIEKYEFLIGLAPDYEPAYRGIATALGHLAEITDSEQEKKVLLQRVVKFCEQGAAVKPSAGILNNWSTALLLLAELETSPRERWKRQLESLSKSKSVLLLDPLFQNHFATYKENINSAVLQSTDQAERDGLLSDLRQVEAQYRLAKNKRDGFFDAP
jgi:hypothetical protein